MSSSLRRGSRCALGATLALTGCDSTTVKYDTPDTTPDVCADALSDHSVASDSPALIVTDPEALSRLALQDVLQQLIDQDGITGATPGSMMERLFDSSNTKEGGVFPDMLHCDSPENPAHVNGPAAFCPRAEAALANSKGFFTPGDPDYFYPVAAVNRIDRMDAAGASCGEYHLVYAKTSGLTDPNNRVLLIFEVPFPGGYARPVSEARCKAVASFWKDLETMSAKAQAESLRSFFFDGLAGIGTLLTPANLGFGSTAGGYYNVAPTGQVRLSQHIDTQWEMREVHLASHGAVAGIQPLSFFPTVVGNNPMPALFEAGNSFYTSDFRAELGFAAPSLAAHRVPRITMSISQGFLSGESALGGPAVNDYATRSIGNDDLKGVLQSAIENGHLSADCPAGDPLTPESLIQRATMESCAGCHAPSQFLGPERKIGCGLTWPDSLGETHIDESGHLSPALKEVFLPHRAEIMTKILGACSESDLQDALFPPEGGTSTKSFGLRRTAGGSATH